MSKVAVIGMVGNSAFLSVDRFHTAGETVTASTVHFEPGGKGFNQAVAAARFGAEVAFLGAVGTEFYHEIGHFLREDGILSVLPRKDAPTAFASILTDAKGANQVTVYQGARLTAEDVEAFEEHIAQAEVLLLNNEVPQEVNIRAIEIAKKYGVFVMLNPAPAVQLPKYIVDTVDLFTPNEHETAGLEGKDNVIVTLGARGCLLKAAGRIVPALRLAHVVDTTGAGDTFNGVLAACLAAGETMEAAVDSAVKASGVSATKKYAATAIPTKEEVQAFVTRNDTRS